MIFSLFKPMRRRIALAQWNLASMVVSATGSSATALVGPSAIE